MKLWKQILILLMVLLLPNLAYAAGLIPCGGTGESPCKFTDIFVLVARVTNWLIGVAGIYAVYHIIFASFGLITSQGNEEAITGKKKEITNAIVGMVMVFFAFMFINTAVNYILVNKKDCYTLDLTKPLCYLNANAEMCGKPDPKCQK